MNKYARLVGGCWLDVQSAESLADIESQRYPVSVIAEWNATGVGFQECPTHDIHGDPLVHGAAFLEEGEAENPQPPVVEFRTLTSGEATKLLVGAWGIGKTNELLLKYPLANLLLLQASTVDRASGNLPVFLDEMVNAGDVTPADVTHLESLWRLL